VRAGAGGDAAGAALGGDGGALHAALEQVANVRLLVNDDHDAVRLDGLDGVGREVARRALGKLFKKPETAADAMSGARPGARREQTDNYVQKLDDLERIGGSFPGVERAFAVQGGREVRVYVKPEQVSDLRAVELSSEIAARISAEMTFPGQIKVTVIRKREAVEVAG
jgi:hypothetical protein